MGGGESVKTEISPVGVKMMKLSLTHKLCCWVNCYDNKTFHLQGTLAGILIGLAQLNCSELKLKRLCYRHG